MTSPREAHWTASPYASDAEINDQKLDQACATIVARVVTMAAPLQLEGWVGGLPFEFRSRHGRWTIGDHGSGNWEVSEVSEALMLVLECPYYKQHLYNWPADSRTA